MPSDPLSVPNSAGKAVEALPIQAILLVEHMRGQAGGPFEATSLPGHLLHFVTHGEVIQECNGRHYHLRPGSLLWYHEDEFVRGEAIAVPWRFYSVNFVAPLLAPPPYEGRLITDAEALRTHFEALLAAWEACSSRRPWMVHAALNTILAALLPTLEFAGGEEASQQLWWSLEMRLRTQLEHPIDLALMERLAHASPSTIARACQAAVGQSPMKRVKRIRLSLARGLVQRSNLTMTAIAHRVGYPRVHEFSRDYKLHFGHAPSQEVQRQ